MTFCMPANDYNALICIIAGALPMFSAREYVSDIHPVGRRPRECVKKYCP